MPKRAARWQFHWMFDVECSMFNVPNFQTSSLFSPSSLCAFVVNLIPMSAENQQPPAECKTLDDRAKMSELERIRHSCAHVMATAILRLWPDAQFAYGPPVENGFYYDIELSHRISPEDFPTIETEMKKEIKANNVFEKLVVTREQAVKDAQSGRLGGLAERPGPSKFKADLLNQIPEGEAISYFKNGDFIDLCAGPHVMRTGNVGAFRLTTVASAYYKGDERNPQLQRIYGTAFKNKTEMEAYFKMVEEAKRRDHRKIGQEMGLFVIDTEYVGPGLPMWLPKGAAICEELEKLAKETEFAAGYVRVKTPHIAKEKMYLTSGHLPLLYADSMFPPMQMKMDEEQERAETDISANIEKFETLLPIAEAKIQEAIKSGVVSDTPYDIPLEFLSKSSEGTSGLTKNYTLRDFKENFELMRQELQLMRQEREAIYKRNRYYLKAMNCPHHHRIFAAEPRSSWL